MSSYQAPILSRMPIHTFNRLKRALQQMAQEIAASTLVLTEDIFYQEKNIALQQIEQFILVVSEQFSALLLGQKTLTEEIGINETNSRINITYSSELSLPANSIHVGLTFEPEAITSFITELASGVNHDLQLSLENIRQILKPNNSQLQSKFTLLLLEILADNPQQDTSKSVNTQALINQSVEDTLSQPINQERLLNQVITQISKSLELPVILTTAVEQARNLLQVDRLVIYEFEELAVDGNYSKSKRGRITYEARASENIVSVLNLAEEDKCFIINSNCWDKYRRKFTLLAEDVESIKVFSPCLVELMQKVQVRAKLVVPIIVQEQLWGLLIAHECFEPRQWQKREKTFLQHIAEHLAIAIYQAQLYAQLQQEKANLEHRVIERTQALHDALLAAQAAAQAKSEFLATISHELRTPLTAIIGLSSTLLHWSFAQVETLSGKKKVEIPIQNQQKYLKTIHDSGEHLLDLINDILDLSQLEAGKEVLNITNFYLPKLAKQILQSLAEKSEAKKVNLALDLQIERQTFNRHSQDIIAVDFNTNSFSGDEERLKQILLHLLTNAIKFTPEGGNVTLRVWREEDTAVFQVEDTGIGIPEHQLMLIFEKFQQLEEPYQRNYEGIGLGLALTKQLVELHGGRIEVESVVGSGSTFTVWLPAQYSAIASSHQPTTNFKIPLGSIVLLEAQEEIAIEICNILTTAGYQVVWLIEGSTAFKHIELLQPKAAIVDMRSPGIDGYDFITNLRNSQATQHIKIMVLTELEIPEAIQSGINAGADDFLVNPTQPEQLLHKIAALMAS